MLYKTNEREKLKQLAAEYTCKNFVKPNLIVGIGTGSTVTYFIKELAKYNNIIKGVVSSSNASTELLKQYNFNIYDLNHVDGIDIYVDGADEVNNELQMIKGGGGALTREKILAAVSKKFICIVDESKKVKILGKFPLPIEVIPCARSYVARQMVKFGGVPNWRNDVITDNGNWILDVYNLNIINPKELEKQFNQIPGVVTNGIFALRPANELVVAKADDEVQVLTI